MYRGYHVSNSVRGKRGNGWVGNIGLRVQEEEDEVGGGGVGGVYGGGITRTARLSRG